MTMKLITPFLLLLLVASVQAQPAPEEIEARLADKARPERLEVLVELVTALREEDADRAVEWGEEALAFLEAHPDPKRHLDLLNSLSLARIVLGDHEQALELGHRAGERAREAGDKSARAFALGNVGRAHRSSSAYESGAQSDSA